MTLSAKNVFFVSAGFTSLSLGIAGIFLPLLPTTPFILLSSFCFLKSSRRLYRWLIHHRIFGKYIYNYITYRAIPMKTKILAVAVLWLSIAFSILAVKEIIIIFILFSIGIGVSIHILRLRTMKNKKMGKIISEHPDES